MTAAGVSLIAYTLTSLAILITYFLFFPMNSQSKYQYTTTPAYLRPAFSFLVPLSSTLYRLCSSDQSLFTFLLQRLEVGNAVVNQIFFLSSSSHPGSSGNWRTGVELGALANGRGAESIKHALVTSKWSCFEDRLIFFRLLCLESFKHELK